ELDADDATIHATYGGALRSWNATTSATLRVADRLYAQAGLALQEPFLAITRDDYDAPLELLDFGADPDAARGTINRWVETRTEQRIPELLPSGAITPLTRLVLVNAVYFKGTWRTPFDPAETEPRTFLVQGIAESNVTTMRARGRFSFGRGDGVQVLELPYAGDELSMLLVLPSTRGERSVGAVEETLSERVLTIWRAAMSEQEVEVQLPRFRLEPPSAPLSGALQALGMRDAFRETADFRGMAGPQSGLYLAEVYHKAFIEVTEEGTEAAAATGVVVATRSARPQPEPARFIADHPFLFFIVERRTGAILFLGRVSDPR
ncbi:MAG: serpin family protein, partial [Polyangiales bacterium]